MDTKKRTILSKIKRRVGKVFRESITECCVVCDFPFQIQSPQLENGENIIITSQVDIASYRDRFSANVYREFVSRTEHSEGLIMFVDGEYACSLWLTEQPREREGAAPFFYSVAPPAGWVYIYDAFASKRFRGHGHFHKLSRWTHAWIQAQGYQGMFLFIDGGEPRWLAFYEKLGFRKIGAISYERRLWQVDQDLRLLEQFGGDRITHQAARTQPRRLQCAQRQDSTSPTSAVRVGSLRDEFQMAPSAFAQSMSASEVNCALA